MIDMNGAPLHPVLEQWFRASFGEPTDVQRRVWQGFRRDEHVLIAAPTGSGKTVAALLPCLDILLKEKERESAEGADSPAGVRLLYVTPLKALNNDVHHHIVHFAEHMKAAAESIGAAWPGLSSGIRTGDTPQSVRAAMLKRPPDLLVTTPESLYLMLTSAKARLILRTVQQVIVDEIHDLAAGSRGTHLSVTLERLVEWCGRAIQRIGVSATQKPLERVARFLGGWEGPETAKAASDGKGVAATDGEDGDAADSLLVPVAGDQVREAASRPGSKQADTLGVSEGEADASKADTGRTDAGKAGYSAAGGGAARMPSAVPLSYDREYGLTPDSLGLNFRPRPVRIIESAMDKQFDVIVTMPHMDRITADKEAIWTPLVERIMMLMEGSRSTLIFANNRRLCERLTLRLNEHAGFELARSHHGSVSREKRLEVERALKAGELRCLVATSSLELGIDVGHVDLVLQLDSPQSAAAGIQRIGRAGHAVGDVSRGAIIARSRGVLAESALLARLVASRDIEDIRVPRDALDVLCQQVVAMAAADDWPLARLGAVLARSDAYRGLSRARLESALAVLAGYFPFARPLLEWDRAAAVVRSGKSSAMAAVMGAGTIPQSTAYPVHHADSRVHIGELDEEYIHESRAGDVFQLGTSSWQIQSIKNDRVYVVEAANAFSEIPFWRAEAPGRSYELSVKLGQFIAELAERIGRDHPLEVTEWLNLSYRMDSAAADQLIALVQSQKASAAVPTDRRIVVEHYRDEVQQHHIVIHSLFGRRLNRTWLLVLQQRLESLFPYKAYAVAKDNGIEFVLPEWDASWIGPLLAVTPTEAERLLQDAVPGSPLFGSAFRRLAETSLLLPRSFRRMPAWKKRFKAEELLREALPHASAFPFIGEAVRQCLTERLDLYGLMPLLEQVRSGGMEIVVRDSLFPSPFAAQFALDFVNTQMYESDAIGKDLQLHLLSVNRELAGQLFGAAELARTVAESAAREREQANVGDEAGLLRWLKRNGDSTEETIAKNADSPDEAIRALRSLGDSGQALTVSVAGQTRWICADEANTYARFPGSRDAVQFIVGRYIDNQLYFTREQLCEAYGLTSEQSSSLIAEWERRGDIETSPFAVNPAEGMWTSSKAAAKMIRISAGRLRHQAEPIDPVRYMSSLMARQHAVTGAKLKGMDGLREAVADLQGLFMPISIWESVVFPSRVSDYRKEWLDLLCASGEVVWTGRKADDDKEGKIAFFLAESKELLAPCLSEEPPQRNRELYELLRSKGASFLTAISRDAGAPPSEVMEALIELAWEGKVSNDQFAPMRLHGAKSAASKARSGKAAGKFQSGLGRWYVLSSLAEDGTDREKAIVQWTHQLIRTYGLITKEIADLQPFFTWEDMLESLRKLENWGMITRGLWVRGVPGLQFATGESVDVLRQPPLGDQAELTLLSSVDPANPFGLAAKWPDKEGAAFARKSGNYIVMAGGRWVLWIENNGRRFVPMDDSWSSLTDEREARIKDICRTLLKQSGARKLVVDSWNGKPLPGTANGAAFERLGAEKDQSAYVVWPSALT